MAVVVDGTTGVSSPYYNVSNGLYQNVQTISATFTINSGTNAMSAGPISIATGYVVTIPTGSRWAVV
jgi:hypothetical protein